MKFDPNPILDTMIYEIEFPDRRLEEYGINTILECMISKQDEEGQDLGILDEVIGVGTDPKVVIQTDENSHTVINGRKKPVITTKGVDVEIK